MKISLNWLKKYVDIKVPDEELVRLIGARLVEVEEVIDETHKYDNIFVIKVVECEAIEGTHLHLCKIDAGKDELVQVVCGAPNVHAGMLAAWIAPGAIVPQSVHEDAPFVIGTRKMLGKYESHGMLAGADELDFGTDHSGIVEIDPSMAKPGDALADIFDLEDRILDIENKSLTHRPDCFGLYGFAREVAGILGEKFHNERVIKNDCAAKTIKIESDSNICPRYSALVLEKHGEIKKPYLTWQDTILAKSGMRPIDPIVDATNYCMLLTGQPLHAFDYDKFVAVGKSNEPKIIVRLAKKGEKLTLLDDSEVELNENDIVITSNDIPVALAGAMGGKSTMIDENTKNVILESATFSLYNLRKTQMSHGIFSEAITRFTKGQPAYQTLTVAHECAALLSDGFQVAGAADTGEFAKSDIVVKITTEEINQLLGTKYTTAAIIKTLENVEFKVKNDGSKLEVTAPAWRTDIHIKEDIIEEVGRLNGYDNITPTLPLHATAEKNPMLELKSQIRDALVDMNANELLTYTFIHGDLMKKVGQNPENSYRIINSISPDLQYLRQTIAPSLMAKAYENLKAKHAEFALFEMNQVYGRDNGLDEDGVPKNQNHLALIVAKNRDESEYYVAKKYLQELASRLGFKITLKSATEAEKYFELKRSADIVTENQKIGTLGEIRQGVAKTLKLPLGTAVFEINLDQVLAAKREIKTNFEICDFPFVSRDLTIKTNQPYAEIFAKISAIFEAKKLLAKITPTSIYQAEKTEKPSLSFHLEFANQNKTLDAAEIQGIMAELEKIA